MRRVVVSLLPVAAACLASLFALGAPASGAPAAPGTTVTQQIQPQQTYSTRSNVEAQTIRIPIPDGLTPEHVHATLVFDNDATGHVEFLARNELVATVAKTAETRTAPVSFPVTKADLEDGQLVFSMRYVTSALTDPKLFCIRTNDGNVSLQGVSVRTTGQAAAPTTVADFFSDAVRTVAIKVPATPDRDLQEAALDATAAITHRYPSTTAVTVTTPDQAARAARPTAATGRVVEFVPGSGEAHTTITTVGGIPTLTITGDPSALPAAAAALGDELLQLAQTPNVTRLTQTGVQPTTPTVTLADLGQTSPQLSGLGESEWSVGVGQSDFGAGVKQIKIHLVGRYTELPPQVTAVLTYYWNGHLVDSQVFDNDHTAIDKTITIPKTQITAGNTLTVQLNAVPSGDDSTNEGNTPGQRPTFDCTGAVSFLPVVASFDGRASSVTGTQGQPYGPGFARFPQTLGNALTVAYGGSEPASGSLTDTAVLLRQLQLVNASQLSVRVVSAHDLMSSGGGGLLVDGTADQVNDLKAPLRMAEFRSIDRSDVDFGVGVRSPFAALQAFQQNGRDLLLLSSWSPDRAGEATATSLQHALVDGLARDPNGWYGLSGDLAIQHSADAEPVIVDSDSIVPQPERVNSVSPYVWWILAFVAVLILLVVAQQVSKRRLRRRAAAIVDAQQSEDEPDEP